MNKIIEQYNDLLSAQYDEATQKEFKWLAPSVMEKHIKLFLKAGIDVLDIGVGTGQTSKIFINHHANVTGLDISKKMLALAKSKYNFKRLIRCDIEEGLLHLFPEERFDVIVAIGILEFTKNIKKVLRDMKQLLKKGGNIAFTYEVYEPTKRNGREKETSFGSGLGNAPINFKVYRRTPQEIDDVLKDLSLTTRSRERFVGYLRSQLKIPVPYELLVVTGF